MGDLEKIGVLSFVLRGGFNRVLCLNGLKGSITFGVGWGMV